MIAVLSTDLARNVFLFFSTRQLYREHRLLALNGANNLEVKLLIIIIVIIIDHHHCHHHHLHHHCVERG